MTSGLSFLLSDCILRSRTRQNVELIHLNCTNRPISVRIFPYWPMRPTTNHNFPSDRLQTYVDPSQSPKTMASRLSLLRALSRTQRPRPLCASRVRTFVSSPQLRSDVLQVVFGPPHPTRHSLTPPAAPQHARKQPVDRVQVHTPERKSHRRDPGAVPAAVQEGGGDAAAGPGPAAARLYEHQRHARGRAPTRDAAHACLRGGVLLHHVQPLAGRQVARAGVHDGTAFALH